MNSKIVSLAVFLSSVSIADVKESKASPRSGEVSSQLSGSMIHEKITNELDTKVIPLNEMKDLGVSIEALMHGTDTEIVLRNQ